MFWVFFGKVYFLTFVENQSTTIMLNAQQIQKNIEAVQAAIDSMIDLIDKGILKDSLRSTLNLLRDKESEFQNDLEQVEVDEHGLAEADYYTGLTREG